MSGCCAMNTWVFSTFTMFIPVTSQLTIVDVVSLVSFVLAPMPCLLDNGGKARRKWMLR